MNIMKFKNLYFAISAFFILASVFFLLSFGLRLAIDFTGGSLLEVVVSEATTQDLENIAGNHYQVAGIQALSDDAYIIRGETITNDVKNQLLVDLSNQYQNVEELQFSTVGPVLGRETLIKMLTAMVLVAVIITLYVWKQFDELKYGICAIAAMSHDTFILVGFFSFFGWLLGVEVDILFVTALLTTLSFSIHDTIVVYDRIRELRRKHRNKEFKDVVNAAVLETLSRSINNSLTIIIMLLALAVLGGDTIRWFAVALLIGAITGTYSSTFTAAPLLLLWEQVFTKSKPIRQDPLLSLIKSL
jgi:preprotein translocase subunit SecF